MADTSDILLSIAGFIISFYGGLTQELVPVVMGMLLIFLNLTLKLQNQEQDIRILQAQINTQNELKKIREELKSIKDRLSKQ